MKRKSKKKKPTNTNGRKGKPISLHPLSVEEALKKAMDADPKKIPKPSGQ